MLSALKLSALGAALALAGSAVAGEAPVAFYPSLGYGQDAGIEEVAPGAYVDEPAYGDSYGPPRGYVGEPVRGDSYGPPPRGYAGDPVHGPAGPCCGGPPPPCHCSRPPPPPAGPPVVYGEDERRGVVERGRVDEHVYGEVRRDEYDYDSGWRIRRIPLPAQGCPYARMPAPHPVCGEREHYAAVGRISDAFFADAGGVGPDEFYGGGGGGGGVVVGGGASAGSFAFAGASARAGASVGIRIGRHGGGGHGGHMSHGCGCKK